jgi:hypothetical protein
MSAMPPTVAPPPAATPQPAPAQAAPIQPAQVVTPKPVALVAAPPDITNMPPDQSTDRAQQYADLAKQLDSTPAPTYDAPKYKPPNKTGEIVAGLLSVLFPGAPIATLAAGYLKGGNEGAKERYEREQQAAQQKYTVAQNAREDLERQEAAAGAAVDRQQKQVEDWDYKQQTLALRADQLKEAHDRNVASVRATAIRLQQGGIRLGLARSNLARLITKDQNQVALALTHDALSEDQADHRLAQAAQIAAMNEFGRNTRFTQDQAFVNGRAKIMAVDRAVQSMITAEMNPLNTDPPEVKQQKVQSLLDSFDKTYDTVITPLSAKHPEIGQIADTLTSAAYGTDEYTNAGPSAAPETEQSPNALYRANGGTGGGSGAPVQSTFGPPPGARAQMPPTSLLQPLEQLAMRAGAKSPADARALAIVAANESAGNRYAANPAGTGVGLWQINPEAHGPGNWTDPLTNARKAVQLFYSQGLQPWADSANKGAFGGWSTMVTPQPGPGSTPGADLSAYLAPPPPPGGTPGNKPGAATSTNGNQPPNVDPAVQKQQALQAGITKAVDFVKADPAKNFNAVEQNIAERVKAGVLTKEDADKYLAAIAKYKQPTPAGLTSMRQQPPPTPEALKLTWWPTWQMPTPGQTQQFTAYAAQMLARVRAMPPEQRAAFIAKQPPQLQAYLTINLPAQTPNVAAR